jgi:hypothetical protein
MGTKESLYKIAEEFKEAVIELEALEGYVDQETIDETIDSLSYKFDDKVKGIAAYCKNLEKDVLILKEYEKETKDRISAISSKIQSLKDYVVSNMESAGIKKVKGTEFDVSLRTAPPALKIKDAALVTDKYIEIISNRKVKNADIKKDLLDGESLGWATLEQKKYVHIK